MKINIIMSVYNSIATLSDCLESIYNQSYKDWHMFLIDDASDDGSEILINNIKEDRVTILRNKTNKGLAYSLNRAIKLCDADFIARADSDDIQHKDRLSCQIKYLIKNNNIDLLCSAAYISSSKGYKILNMSTSHNEISRKIKNRNCIIHPTVMVKKSFFEKFGLYNKTFLRAQDYELWLRALKKGAVFGAINKPLIYYNTNNYSWSLKTIFNHSYSRLRIFFKYQKLTSITFLISDILHPYFLKLISIFNKI